MPEITYVHPDGTKDTVDAAVGMSVMQAATSNDVDGIVAECGGNAMCATCHVYVDEAFVDGLGPVGDAEEEMLECTASARAATSRLSCQIEVTPERAGLVVRLPETQV